MGYLMSLRFVLRHCARRRLEEVRNMFMYLACLPTETPVALMHLRKAMIRFRSWARRLPSYSS